MTPSSQKADVRPISFVLHDEAAGAAPFEYRLSIRPEDLVVTRPSRTNVVQTLGGAWVDSFGEGVVTAQISGHTGWRGNSTKDGVALFQELHDKIFKAWHAARATALESGQDPDLVKMIFSDVLDSLTWVVAPSQFVLRRSKSRPLLAQYQIGFTRLSDTLYTPANPSDDGVSQDAFIASLEASLATVMDFAENVSSAIRTAFAPIISSLQKLASLTGAVLSMVKGVVSAGMSIVGAVSEGLVGVATLLTRSAANIMQACATIANIPQMVRGQVMRVASAFNNMFCLLRNGLRGKASLASFEDIYGASMCSSTAGGRPLSSYLGGKNTFSETMPVEPQKIAVSADSHSALMSCYKMDNVLAPPTMTELGGMSDSITAGVVVRV